MMSGYLSSIYACIMIIKWYINVSEKLSPYPLKNHNLTMVQGFVCPCDLWSYVVKGNSSFQGQDKSVSRQGPDQDPMIRQTQGQSIPSREHWGSFFEPDLGGKLTGKCQAQLSSAQKSNVGKRPLLAYHPHEREMGQAMVYWLTGEGRHLGDLTSGFADWHFLCGMPPLLQKELPLVWEVEQY